MKKQPNQKTLLALEKLAKKVKSDLKRKGIVIPVKESDGSITVDGYRIIKEPTGYYSVRDFKDEPVVKNINLPETAALLANDLALGKWVNNEILNKDRHYGYKLFEELLARSHARNSLKNNDIDRADILFTKSKIASDRSKNFKNEILTRFEKLRRLR